MSGGADEAYLPGTHRVAAPGQTLERVRPFLARMGITRIADITGLDRVGIPTVLVCRPNSRSIAVAQGKGADLAAAKASGVMEAIEIFHAETIALPVRYARRDDMEPDLLADLDGLPRQRAALPPGDLAMLWIEGRNLACGRTRWLPLETVSTDYTLPQLPGSGWFQATTNGLASGNTAEEARLHGLCELVERDATTLWSRGGARAWTCLDLAGVDDSMALDLLTRFASAGVAVAVWEATSDIGVACFVALAAGVDDGADPELGAGCHPARGVALCRALAEAAQARVGFVSGARDDLLPSLYAPEARRRRAARARAWLEAATPARRFVEVPDFAGQGPAADLAHVLERLRAAGLDEILAVDLTRPEFAIPVVRMVVPGLEGPDEEPGWRPGRRARAVLGDTA